MKGTATVDYEELLAKERLIVELKEKLNAKLKETPNVLLITAITNFINSNPDNRRSLANEIADSFTSVDLTVELNHRGNVYHYGIGSKLIKMNSIDY